MIDLAPVLKIAPVFMVCLVAPGPDFMLISSLSMSKGRMSGLAAAGGIAVGVMLYALLCLLGLGYVFAQMKWLMVMIKIMGGFYLIYLGYELWRVSFKKVPKNASRSAAKSKNPFLSGLLTNLTNPKALVFFTSVFALILTKNANLLTEGAIILYMGMITFVWFGFVTFGLSSHPMRKVYMRLSKWIDRVAGSFLTLFGLRLILAGRD